MSDSAPTAQDRIRGFKHSQGDRIDLSDIDANANLIESQSFTFIQTSAFSGVAGQLRYEVRGNTTYVEADVNGDKAVDLSIALTGKQPLEAVDFIL